MSARSGELTLLSVPWAFIQKLSPMAWRQFVGIKALQGHSSSILKPHRITLFTQDT